MNKSLVKSLKELTVDNTALLIYTPISRYYISGFISSLGYLFITKDSITLLVDGRYFENAKKSIGEDIKVLLLTDLKTQAKQILNNVNTLLVEAENKVCDILQFEKIFRQKVVAKEQIDKLISSFRSVKTDFEIGCIKKAQEITEKAFEHILNFIKPGVTENEIAAELEYVMKKAGSSEPSFQTIAIAGKKTSMPHGVPSDNKVLSSDFVTMDFGAVYMGYHSDMTRTVAVTNATEEMKNVYNILLNANKKAIDSVIEGTTCKNVDLKARNYIENAGYGKEFCHSTGHGVGLEIHEEPTISYKNEAKLKAGQVITIEPGIYLPNKFGVRIEDMLVVLKNGYNNLTKCDKTLIIL